MLINRVGGGGDAQKPVTNGKIEEWKASNAGDIPANTFVEKTKQIQPGTENLYDAGKIVKTSILPRSGYASFFRFPDGKVGAAYRTKSNEAFVEVVKVNQDGEISRVALAQLGSATEYSGLGTMESFALSNNSFVLIYEAGNTRKAQMFTISGSSLASGTAVVLRTSPQNSSGYRTERYWYEGAPIMVAGKQHVLLLEKTAKDTLNSSGYVTSSLFDYAAITLDASGSSLVQKDRKALVTSQNADRGCKIFVNTDETYINQPYCLIADDSKLHIANLYLSSNGTFSVYKCYQQITNPSMVSIIHVFSWLFGANIGIVYYGNDAGKIKLCVGELTLIPVNTDNNQTPINYSASIELGSRTLITDRASDFVSLHLYAENNAVLIHNDYGSIDVLKLTTEESLSINGGFDDLIGLENDRYVSINTKDVLIVPLNDLEAFAVLYFGEGGEDGGDSSLSPIKAAIVTKGKEEEVVVTSKTRIDGITKDDVGTTAKGEVWMLGDN